MFEIDVVFWKQKIELFRLPIVSVCHHCLPQSESSQMAGMMPREVFGRES
jgi:hypothetical protein